MSGFSSTNMDAAPLAMQLLQRTCADGGDGFFRSLGIVVPGPCPPDRQRALAREVLRQFDRLRYLFRYLNPLATGPLMIWEDQERRVFLHLGRSFLSAEPPRVTNLSYVTFDLLQVEVQSADMRCIFVTYGLHPLPTSERTLRQRMAGRYPQVISRWMEVPWPSDPAALPEALTGRAPPARVAMEMTVADAETREFVSRNFYWIERN